MKYNFVCSHYPENTHSSHVSIAVVRECEDNVEVCREALKIFRYISSSFGFLFKELSIIVFTDGDIEDVSYFGQLESKFVREGLYETRLYNKYMEIEEFVEHHEAIDQGK